MRDKIKAVLDRECKNRHLTARYDFERGGSPLFNAPRCDNDLPYPSSESCWLCHKHDALAQEIAEIKEVL